MRQGVNRHVWLRLHRWAGLCMALFLTVAGLTGTVLVFYEELEHWLNRRWQYRCRSPKVRAICLPRTEDLLTLFVFSE